MYYKLEENSFGEYTKKNIPEIRYNINECNTAYTPQGKNVGYEFFESREAFLEKYDLVYNPIN